MLGRRRKQLGVVAIAGGLVAFSPQSAAAASIVCPNDIGNNAPISDNVTPSTGCAIGGLNNDFKNPLQVNLDAMFGFTDWIFAEKVLEEADENVDIGLQVTGGINSGTWQIDDVWTTLGISDLMLVFKGGASANIEPNIYVGYLIADGATSGTYLTPFKNLNGKGNATGISHISAYYRIQQNTVPEPQMLVLFGVGLLCAARRLRRVRATS